MTYMRARSIDFASVFSGVRVTRSLLLCVCFVDRFCHFVRFLLVIVLSVIRYTDSDYLPLICSNSSYIFRKAATECFIFYPYPLSNSPYLSSGSQKLLTQLSYPSFASLRF